MTRSKADPFMYPANPGQRMTPSILANYDPAGFYCEMLRDAANQPIRSRLAALSIDALKLRAAKAEAGLFDQGVTFTVYSDKQRSTASCRST